jgi:iron complex outermembrane receptor protein
MQQDIVEANFQGSLFPLPAGTVSAALGYQFRRDSGQFAPDGLQATNSFLDQTVGLYPLGTLVREQISSKDGYAELYVPILKDLPFLEKLGLNLGGRFSDNSITSNSTTFKVDVDASITKSFRIRGGFNRATRAPNLGELFLGEQEYFGGAAQFGDPCSVRSVAPFGAGGAAADTSASAGAGATKVASGQTAAGANSSYLICQAQMGAAGATQYYNGTNQGTQAAAAQFAWLNEEGNPNLRSETADTWTGGFVIDHLSDNPWIKGLSGSVDWWQINLKNAIELDSPDYANFLCYGTVTVTDAASAAAQAATPACQNVGRSAATGLPTTTLLQYTNQANIAEAGVDFGLNWIGNLMDLGLPLPGALTFSTQDSFLNYYRTKQSPATFDVVTNWKGSMGPNLVGTNGGAYSYRLFSSVGYVLPSVAVQLRWRFLPSVNSAAHATQEAIVQNNNAVAGGAKGTLLSYTPNTDLAAPAYSLFDLSGSWTVSKNLTIRGGVNNLLNKDPAISPTATANGARAGFPVGTNLNAVCSAAAASRGCVNPTAYSLPNDGAGATSPGYYDVYGRTFFLGVTGKF